ncbi:TonB-dependent receptor [Tenacibaculum sp. IB213877]|uniref:TonB-dependent receptor n=1 Tax=Tenacibaculum sp. IB213877 TaxID=3097351 RepID=UPI002A5AE31F|nr:TonB-dependent receptor plug domain-containing protein [Tenacibaculum sp. IB213877]MDY0779438.1 TonB-dependent receptor plug domain-containing protein [Tenacibaculum sp. IB213877]
MKPFFSLILLFTIFHTTFSQSIKGIVLNSEEKPIQEAYILHQKTGNHVHTDANGFFIISNISENDILSISHVSYQPKNITVNNIQDSLKIYLTEREIKIPEIVINPTINALNLFTNIDLEVNPVNSSQEILRKVPGLIIGQHAGGGKAEQLFLRGFDLDHGTDIAIDVDGIPVNMVSHAHGQGYADLHFLIPETVQKINFGKGSYYANQGNFSTAGHVSFATKDYVKDSSVKVEMGQFNTSRFLGIFNLLNEANNSAYIASELLMTDGPFDSPQNFNRFNIFGKYKTQLNENDKLAFTLSHFTSSWDASGQIPQRAVDNGSIDRFGAIDDTEGGLTSRSNFLLNYDKQLSSNTLIKNRIYYSKYNFELYSNFTFFLEDPVNGDQIKQQESRDIFGFLSEINKRYNYKNTQISTQTAIGYRRDKSNANELSHTLNRKTTLNQIQLGNIDETNFFGYVNAEFKINKWVINPALRLDHFKFIYNDLLSENYTNKQEQKSIISPKLNILYNQSKNLQLYLKSGKGFHSNDTRGVISQNGTKILPASYGADLGFIWSPNSNLIINTAAWYLYLDQEFVYVGDAGIVEPSGKTIRKGIDFGIRYHINDWLFFNNNINYTYARAIDEEKGNDYIPLAPDLTITGGLNLLNENGFYGGLNYRYLKSRPANEDNSIVAKGYFITDFNFGKKWKNFDVGITINNLFNSDWNETQFATESRLENETESVEEIHFTPGTPFYLKSYITYKF